MTNPSIERTAIGKLARSASMQAVSAQESASSAIEVWPISLDSRVWPPSYGFTGELGLDALTERLSPAPR